MAILFVILAGLLCALANLLTRRSIDSGGSARGYMAVQLSFTLIVSLSLNSPRQAATSAELGLGLGAGLLLGLVMWSLGRSLERGPAGLTFAVVNSSTVMPGVLMAMFFGAFWGHPYSIWHAIGSVMVVTGLFWAGWEAPASRGKRSWMALVLMAFAAHTALLCFLQWRALLMNFDIVNVSGQWFIPLMYVVAAGSQVINYLFKERRLPYRSEMLYGLGGGALQAVCAYLLVLSTQVASPLQNAMIFPTYAVTIIVASNAWAHSLYRERINWPANIICATGLFVGGVAFTI